MSSTTYHYYIQHCELEDPKTYEGTISVRDDENPAVVAIRRELAEDLKEWLEMDEDFEQRIAELLEGVGETDFEVNGKEYFIAITR